MEFPYTYFEDEVREGFYISGCIKRAWAAQLEVLAEIDKICKKHNIRWFADCGTLLGAVRHGGFIPWDDDLDICMLRDDYVRFNEVIEQEKPEGYVVLNLHKEEVYYEYLTRVTNGHRLNFDEPYLKKYHNSPYAVGIDIFPLDYVAPDPEEEDIRKEIAKIVIVAANSDEAANDDRVAMQNVLTEIEELCDVKFNDKKPIKQQLYETAEKIFTQYSSNDAKEVVLMPYWLTHNNHKYPIEYFSDTIMLPFEVTSVPVPASYDGVLTIEYGDYMKIVKGGGVHDYPFVKNQENYLMKLAPNYPLKYKFKEEDLNVERLPVKASKREAESFLGLMMEAHQAIALMLKNGQFDVCRELLASCQNSAISIGNIIEADYGEGYITVKILEEYCELLYQINQIMETENVDIQVSGVIISGIGEISDKISDSIKQDILERKEIVFMPFRACYWDAMESVWKAAVEDGQCDVYVVPIPYYERTASGSLADMHYEGNEFPEYVSVTYYEDYDFEKRHPDVIVIQNPYDQCNYTTSVPPAYFSGNLKQYTEELVYIPYFVMDEIGPNDEKAFFTMEYFCKVPGIVHADKVIVQSEQMREKYIECMTEFAGEETRAVWENKIFGLGSPKTDAEYEQKLEERTQIINSLPAEWKDRIYKDDGSLKKIVLCSTGIASLSQHDSKVTDKLKRTFEVFRAQQDDIVLLWRPHPGIKVALEKKQPLLLAVFERLVEQYKEEGWGIYDDTPDMKQAVILCDAYYGDAGSMARACSAEKKPVLIMSVDM